MAASTTLLVVLLSTAFLICAFVPHASASSYNTTSPALLAFRDVNTCVQAAIAIVKNTDCNPQVSCSSDRALVLPPCATNTFDLLSLNATYYLDYRYAGDYGAQGLAIYYSYTQLLWTFSTTDDLFDFYSSAIYNTTCNINVDKAALYLVMTIPTNGQLCTFPTSTLLPFDSFKSGAGIAPNSASGAESKFASAL